MLSERTRYNVHITYNHEMKIVLDGSQRKQVDTKIVVLLFLNKRCFFFVLFFYYSASSKRTRL